MMIKPGSSGNHGYPELSSTDRVSAIADSAFRRQIDPVIIEKDFWVCWLMGAIFTDPELAPHFVFKGGTSLSKVYGIIERFSEDVDLGITPAFLGISKPEVDSLTSRTSRAGALTEMQRLCGEALEKSIAPRLEAFAQSVLGKPPNGEGWLKYEFDTRVHSPIVYFTYPTVLPEGLGYIQREVKLEIGSLLGEFTSGKPMSSNQIEFTNLIVNHLTEKGAMDASLLYESPFTDVVPQGPEAIFTPAQLDTLMSALQKVKATAQAA